MTGSSPKALAEDIATNTQLSLWSMFQRSVERFADRPAVQMGDEATSYAELQQSALRSAAALAELGVGPGTRVAFLFHACPEWSVLHYALMRLGAVGVPINLAFEAAEIRQVLEAAQPELLVAVASFRGLDFAGRLARVDPAIVDGARSVPSVPSLRWVGVVPLDAGERLVRDHPARRAVFGALDRPGLDADGPALPEDPCYIIFTSGSTAFPKPALCAHRAFLGAATGFQHALLMGPEDRFLAMLPTFHVGGVTCVLTAPHLSGGCADLMGGFDPDRALDTIAGCRSTVTVGFDTMWTKIVGSPRFPRTDVSSLTKAVLACTPTYIDRLRSQWRFDLFTTTYGSTESGTLASMAPPWLADDHHRTRANGRPLPGLDVTIVDPETRLPVAPGELGEICFRGWCRVLEYVGMPEETAAAIDADGYFHSGDYGAIDADGWLYFKGRYKQMIKSGGENVSEREVEVFLEDHLPQVEFAQVVGVPDRTWGEAVVAFVALTETIGSDELRRACAGAISGFKIPKQFIPLAIDAFPVLSNGRPDKHALREMGARRTRDPHQLVADLATLGDELYADVSRLSETDAGVASLCPGWTVRDVLVHLVVGDELALRALRGEDCFPDPTADEPVLAGDARARVEAFGSVTVAEACSRFRAGRDQLLALASGLSAEQLLAKVAWVAKPITRFALVQSRLMETWVHGRDLREPLGLPSPFDDRCWWVNDLGVRHVPYAVRKAGFRPGLSIELSLDGPGGGVWTVATDSAALDRAEVTGPAWAWLLAVTQRANGREEALAQLLRPAVADPVVQCARAFA